jgi:hypothetical protein
MARKVIAKLNQRIYDLEKTNAELAEQIAELTGKGVRLGPDPLTLERIFSFSTHAIREASSISSTSVQKMEIAPTKSIIVTPVTIAAAEPIKRKRSWFLRFCENVTKIAKAVVAVGAVVVLGGKMLCLLGVKWACAKLAAGIEPFKLGD